MKRLPLLGRPVCADCVTVLSLTRRSRLALTKQFVFRRFIASDTKAVLPARTRFAPSPTGYLHLGGLRTALYNFLYARATGGQFVLRIEDTDQSRLVEDAEKKLIDDLRWAGLSWDEGPDVGGKYGPYRQSQRIKLYDEHADQLIRDGHAYRCFCSPEDLEEHKRHALKHVSSPNYPGTCRNLPPDESAERASRGDAFAVRFLSSKSSSNTEFRDIVYGRRRMNNVMDDFILRKRDGFPTYHFANVVDDHAMEITHVIRGAEWLISTTKHLELYKAFGWQPPKFAHVGLLVDEKRQKLSKRHAGVDMAWYRQQSILPPALLNFAVLLGWSHTRGSDVMTLPEMIEIFSLEKCTRGDIVLTMDKLFHLQHKHASRLLQDDSFDKSVISTHFIEPVQAIINKLELARQQQPSTDFGFDLSLVGDLVPKMRPQFGQAELYISQALTLGDTIPKALRRFSLEEKRVGPGAQVSIGDSESSGNAETPSNVPLVEDPKLRENLSAAHNVAAGNSPAQMDLLSYIKDTKYLFWQVPPTVLRNRFEEGMIGTTTIRSESSTLTDVFELFESELRSIPESWTLDQITSKTKQLASDVRYVDKSDDSGKVRRGWAYLRWALLGFDDGPSLARVMWLIGKEETLRRLAVAREVANGI